MATWTKLADNWDALSDTERVALFQNLSSDTSSLADLQALGKFKIAVLTDSNISYKNIVVSGAHKRTVVEPKEVFSVDAYAKINSITLNYNTSGSGNVGIAVSKDLATYFIYDAGAWKEINKDTDAFMSPAIFNGLTDAEWQTLLGTDTTLGIAYSLEIQDTTDVAEVDSLTLNVDMKGMWEKAIYNEDYKYAYSNRTIQIDLLKDGSYKINYPVGSVSFTEFANVASAADVNKLFNTRGGLY